MGNLVMRLETAAAKCDQRVKDTLISRNYDRLAADHRDLFQEAAIRIKELEFALFSEQNKSLSNARTGC